mgnify:CR=1 FL=1
MKKRTAAILAVLVAAAAVMMGTASANADWREVIHNIPGGGAIKKLPTFNRLGVNNTMVEEAQPGVNVTD